MVKRVAVVTGSNKGIGFGIVRALCKQFDGDVFLTARDVNRGKNAVAQLQSEGLNPKFHQLDITDHNSIVALKDYLQANYGGLDVLVNNAGFAFNRDSVEPFSVQARETCKVNYFATKDCCLVLLPLLREHSRVVNVSSLGSAMAVRMVKDETMFQRLTKKDITLEELDQLMTEFVEAAERNDHVSRGFPEFSYGLSKIGLNLFNEVFQRKIDADPSSAKDIFISACCPGDVSTDMSRQQGHLTIDQGAEVPVFLALLPDNTDQPNGEFWSKSKVFPWRKGATLEEAFPKAILK